MAAIEGDLYDIPVCTIIQAPLSLSAVQLQQIKHQIPSLVVATEVVVRGRLVDRENEGLGYLNVRRTRGSKDNVLSDVVRSERLQTLVLLRKRSRGLCHRPGARPLVHCHSPYPPCLYHHGSA